MDQKQIEEIVRSVMASMGQAAPAPSEAKCAATTCAASVTSESCALDLGSVEAKTGIGVENPHRADVLTELRRSTVARVCTGRAGPRPRTQALLRTTVTNIFKLIVMLAAFIAINQQLSRHPTDNLKIISHLTNLLLLWPLVPVSRP